jgi:hypothetical protein
MSTRGSKGTSLHARAVAAFALALLLVGSLVGCGSKSFPNDPRAPAPIEVSAKVDSRKVTVSPDRFGAGLVNFTVANLSNSPIRFTITSPGKHVSSPEIPPGSPGYLKLNMKQGDYRASAGQGAGATPAPIKVGPERKSSQNKLLLP